MPARHHVIAILAFWVASTGWLCYRDLWPRLRSGEPPPFTIDLADEASDQKIFWTLIQDGDVKGYAQTWVKYRENDNTFDMVGEFKFWSGPRSDQAQPDEVVKSTYRVTPEGELREITADVTMNLVVPLTQEVVMIKAHIDGLVRDHRIKPHLKVGLLGTNIEPDLKPVEVSNRGNVLNPLQPLNKLRGLRPGQCWRIPFVDPLDDTVRVAAQVIPGLSWRAPEVPYLEAEVLPNVQALPPIELVPQDPPHSTRKSGIPCLVVRLSGEDTNARIWVREADAQVLRQEITHRGMSLILDRD
jgi:hypothetical protein